MHEGKHEPVGAPFADGATASAASGQPDPPLASIIVTCKGRLHHLRRTLPSMLAQRCAFCYEVVVVDFGCPHGTFDWCRSLDVRNLVALKVLDYSDEFQLSRSRNCGASAARGRLLAFVDADMFLDATWLETVVEVMRHGRIGLCTVVPDFRDGWDRAGSCIVSAAVFHAVRGYDEALRGWGSEDVDFCCRCAACTLAGKFAPSLLTPIKHGHEERVRYQADKDIGASNARNAEYLRQRTGLVNPQGYGRGAFHIFRGSGERLPPLTWVRRHRVVRPIRGGGPQGRQKELAANIGP
jgi:glycosyltransferase involved in cell wall biosynthesis